MIFYKRWLNRQSRFESTPVIQTNGLIKKHYETILMHNFIKLSSLYRAIGCFHVHQSYRGREIDLGLGVVDREMLKKSTLTRDWVTLVTTVQMTFSTKFHYSVLPYIYHVCCHNLTFCFNAMDSTEMMHILYWHVLLPNKLNRPFLGKIHAIHYIRHSILVRSIGL